MKPHLPPHSFRPGEVLINGFELIRIFCSRASGYDYFRFAPTGGASDEPYPTEQTYADPFLTEWTIFEVSGKLRRETHGEHERRRAMIDEARFLLTTPTDRAALEARYGKNLDEILRNQPPPTKHFSAPPMLATPYVPTIPPEHLPKLVVIAHHHG